MLSKASPPFAVSAGAASVSGSGTVVFSNSNGVSFGINGSTITGTVATNYAGTGVTTTTTAGTAIVGTNSTNGLSLGVPAFLTTAALSQDSSRYAGTGFTSTTTAGTEVKGTLSTNGLSLAVPAYLTAAAGGFSAGVSTGGNTAGDTGVTGSRIVFAGGNNLTVSQATDANGATITFSGANAGGAQTGISGIQVSDATYTSGTVTFRNANGISFGSSGANGVSASYTVPTITSWTVSDSATSATVGRLAFTASNGLTLTLSTSNNGNHTVIGSYTVPTVTNSSMTVSDAATSGTLARLAFTNLNGVTLSLSTGAGGSHTIVGSHNALTSQSNQNVTAANGGFAFQTLSFSNANAFSFGTSAGSAITGSYTTPVVSNAIQTVGSATNSGTNTSRFAADDHVHAGVFSVGVSTGGNTAGDTRVDVGRFVLAGGANITLSQATAANALNTISIVGGAGGGSLNVSAGTTSNNLTAITFSNSNGVSFGLDASTITASVAGVSVSATGWASVSLNGSTLSIGASTTQNVYAIGNTSGTSSGTVDIRTVSLAGRAGIVVAASNSGWEVAQPYGSYYSNLPFVNMVTGASGVVGTSGSSLFVQPFHVAMPLSVGWARLLASYNDSAVGTGGTTSANTTFTIDRYTTFAVQVLSQGTGANSRSLQHVTSSSGGITGRTIIGAGANGSRYTVTIQKSYPVSGTTSSYTSSYAVSSASFVISSESNTLFTGPRFLDVPFGVSLSPGNWWLAVGASTSSATTGGASASFVGTAGMAMTMAAISQSNVSVGVLGAATSASDHQLYRGLGIFTTNALLVSTDSIGVGQVSQVASNPMLPFQLMREG